MIGLDITKIRWYLIDLIWFFRLIFTSPKIQLTNTQYSIGITTYKDRYKLYFITLIKKITVLFPDTEIIIAVNGHTDSKDQLIYLNRISKLASRYPNVRLITFNKPQGLSRLWNQIVINASTPRVLLLNDDINFSHHLRKDLETTNFFNQTIALINGSFSFFTISKEFLKEFGGFDERLLEIGGEDDDFCVRMAVRGYSYPPIYFLTFIKNFSHIPKVNSYGKVTAFETNRYSSYNDKFLRQKWDIRDYKFEGSVFSRSDKYWRLEEGMETPDFYKNILNE
jgi:GT2 family glycosyltransferase